MKKFLFAVAVFCMAVTAFAFDWPLETITKDNYKSYFSQNRGGVLSTSLVFKNQEEIKASDDGRLLIIMTENNDDSDFFPSALGTAVIISHEDNLLSVYANMDTATLSVNDKTEVKIEAGTTLGTSGNTGWQDGVSSLEFQIIDTKNSSAINPKILMARSENELPLSLSGIYISNKNGDFFDLNAHKTFSSGLYRIYQKRNPIASPYKTTIMLNGVEFDQIGYDLIVQENGKTCVNGKKKYTSNDVYPDEKLQLLGEAMFTPGKTTLGLAVEDILGNRKNLNYNISIY